MSLTDPWDDPTLAALLAKFAAAESCWFSSVRPDGRVHLAPIWHVWHDRRAYVVTTSNAVRAQNVLRNPSVSLSLPDPVNVLIIEGWARVAPERTTELRPVFSAKFAWDISTDTTYNCVIEVAPTKILAWGKEGEGRWSFANQAPSVP